MQPPRSGCVLELEEVIKMKLLVRWVIVSVALFAAAWIVPGIRVEGTAWIIYAVMALILGLVNATVRPLLKLLTCSLVILTLGLFTMVINGATLWLASWIAVNWLNVGFYVEEFQMGNLYVGPFWTAFLGALVVSIVTVILSALVKEDKKDKDKKVKVIIESGLLDKKEKILACKLVKSSGADFIKTSTGFSTKGASTEDVKLLRSIVGKKFGVKASGGIKTYEMALRMINAGANRIGTSSGVKILLELSNFE